MRQSEPPLREHLTELRKRLLVAVIALVGTTGLSFAFYGQIFDVLLLPARDLSALKEGGFVFIELTEMFAVTMKVSLMAGLVLASPIVVYEIVMFVAPGLTPKERRYLIMFLPGVFISFAAGVAFGYFVLIPPAINFLVNFGGDLATPMIRIGNYVNLVVMLLFWIGLVFETPLVMFLLARLGIASPARFARWRRYWIVVAFVLGAIITPTFDPVNQTLVALPLIVLYELGIWLSKLAARGRKKPIPGVAEAPGSGGE